MMEIIVRCQYDCMPGFLKEMRLCEAKLRLKNALGMMSTRTSCTKHGYGFTWCSNVTRQGALLYEEINQMDLLDYERVFPTRGHIDSLCCAAWSVLGTGASAGHETQLLLQVAWYVFICAMGCKTPFQLEFHLAPDCVSYLKAALCSHSIQSREGPN